MLKWLYWNVVGFVELIILLLLGYNLYRGALITDDDKVLKTKKNAINLVVTFVLLAVVSWVVYIVFAQ